MKEYYPPTDWIKVYQNFCKLLGSHVVARENVIHFVMKDYPDFTLEEAENFVHKAIEFHTENQIAAQNQMMDEIRRKAG